MSNFMKIIKYTMKADKAFYIWMIIRCILQSAITVFGAYSISYIVKYSEAGKINEALICAGILLLIEFVLTLLNKTVTRYIDLHKDVIYEKINIMMSDKIMRVSFNHLEDPSFIELKSNVQMGVNNMGAVFSYTENLMNILSNVISLIALGAIILTFDYWIIIIIAAGFLLTLGITFLSLRFQMKFYKRLIPINFKYSYYIETLLNIKNSKDFRLYNTFDVMSQNFYDYSDDLSKELGRVYVWMYIFGYIQQALAAVAMGGMYILVGIRTITKALPISTFSLTVSAAISFSQSITNIIKASGEFARGIQYLKPLVMLMDTKDSSFMGKDKISEIESIEFDDVSFTYPNTDKVVLDHVSFKIQRGEKISIVGLNGAGKTTIVKLLCRLYDPTSGSILINDKNIEEYDYDSYIKMVSTVFQDFKLFNYSIKDNISPDMTEEECNQIIECVGLKDVVEKLPQKINQNIGKEYDDNGIELSGGQFQKIAIARALAKKSSLLILDEPTSALDPKSEAEIYENFNELALNKTALYISHRMSSSVFCDKILVLDGGHVTDFDSHKNLMKKEDSLYYKLYTTQAENYKLA